MVCFVKLYFNINFYLVFLFYYIWGFFLYFVITFKSVIEYFYSKLNKNFITFKRDFNDLSFFEKLFLVFFSRNDEFKNSVGNIYTNNNLLLYRKNKYPLIFFFHLYSSKMNYEFFQIKTLKIFFNLFKKSKKYNTAVIKLKNIFFKNLTNEIYSNYLLFLILQKNLYKRYYNLSSSIFYKSFNENNLIKLNWLFYLFLLNSHNKLVIYDLSKYSEWYDFTFSKHKNIKLNKIYINKNKKLFFLNFRKKNNLYLINIYKKYNKFFNSFFFKLNNTYKNMFISNLSVLYQNCKLNFNLTWKKTLNVFYPVRFSESSTNKLIELGSINNYLFFFIRKNRIFNKGRYSRNRQLYRTGVYWCLWLNIILVYGLYFLFYRFTFNFGYFWWGLLILFYSTIFSRAIKYNFYNIYKIFLEFINLNKWFGFLIKSFIKDVQEYFIFYKLFFKKYKLYFYFLKFFIFFYKILTKNKLIYFWENINYNDNSLFRYKSIIHWFTQFYKLLTY